MDVTTLIDGSPAIGVPSDPHPKEIFQLVEILHLELLSQLHLHIYNISIILAGNGQIVDLNHDGDVLFSVSVKAGVGRRSDELKKSMDLLVPNVCHLFIAVNGLQQSAFKVPLYPSPYISFRLYHKYFLIQCSKQICSDQIISISWIFHYSSVASIKMMRYIVNFTTVTYVSK